MQTTNRDDGRIDRRTALAAAGGALGAYAALAAGLVDFTRAAEAAPTASIADRRALTEAEWRTLAAALARILPTDELGPGAADVNAIGYLDAALAEPGLRGGTKRRIREGARRLDQRARAAGEPSFDRLDPRQQDAAIRTFERDPEGLKWLRHMTGLALEAFLGDPAHGVNPGEIGWTWAKHKPGTPRPTTPGWTPKERR